MALKATLGPIQLLFYSVGVIVGAGVYSIIGAAAGLAGYSLWISFALASAAALLTAMSYAELTTAYPEAGAEYVYVRRAWPRSAWLAFGVGFILIFGGAAASATVAVAFGGYLRAFVDAPIAWSAFALLVACSMICIAGSRESSALNILFTSIEIAGLLLVIAIGFSQEARPVAQLDAEPSILAAAAILFFVYLGFEEIANLAEEARRPARDLPFALLVSLAITTVLYLLVAIAALRLAAPAELAASDAPLATALRSTSSHAAETLAIVGLFATANTVLISVMAASRLVFAMARDRELPVALSRLLPGSKTPYLATLLVLSAASILIAIGDMRMLAEASSFAALMAFLAVNLALIALRYKQPNRPRPFRAPGRVGRMPIAPLLAIASIIVLIAHFSWRTYAAGAITFAVAGVAFVVREWRRPRPAAEHDLQSTMSNSHPSAV